ncbi:MAG: MaoC domain protein dehydratase [Frankiales bacterium]|nr:MaoC domain protein dehydratase [Frankiales bacterium]
MNTSPASATAPTLSVGAELPSVRIPVTTTLIVEAALASQDLYPGHHDRDFAVDHGMPDVFMNILTTNGLVGRYLTDWAGPGSVLKRLKIRLGVPNLPGDTMTLRGQVTAHDESTGNITVSFRGENSKGAHVTGEADLTAVSA